MCLRERFGAREGFVLPVAGLLEEGWRCGRERFVSTRVMDCCWGLQLPPSEKAVLMSLADQANDAGVCWPGVGSLCERTCLGERTVQRALRALEDAKLLYCEMGAARNGTNRYTLQVALLKQMERDREALKGDDAGLRQATLDLPTPRHGGTPPAMVTPRHHDTPPATMTPPPRHSGTQTVIEPIPIHTPHTPQPLAGGLKASGERIREQAPLLPLADWLAEVQASGQDAVPADDPLWDYAAAVQLPAAYVALCWREFKRRQLRAGKRQRDWRERFRACVEASWYGLWLLAAGQEARLSTPGEQAQRYWDAVDAGQLGEEGA